MALRLVVRLQHQEMRAVRRPDALEAEDTAGRNGRDLAIGAMADQQIEGRLGLNPEIMRRCRQSEEEGEKQHLSTPDDRAGCRGSPAGNAGRGPAARWPWPSWPAPAAPA